MPQSCSLTKFKSTQRGICDCCSQNLCIQHLLGHNASLIAQLNPLTDEITMLGNRLKTLNFQNVVRSSRRKLEQMASRLP